MVIGASFEEPELPVLLYWNHPSGSPDFLLPRWLDMMIKGDPYDYPFNQDLRPTNTALIVIDMQFDFCGEGGYVDKMGYDISLTRAAVEPIRKALTAARLWGCR